MIDSPEEHLRKMLFDDVNSFFKDEAKAKLWFETKNSLLGEISPNEMMDLGRFQKLDQFIQNRLQENKGEVK